MRFDLKSYEKSQFSAKFGSKIPKIVKNRLENCQKYVSINYADMQQKVNDTYKDKEKWNRMSLNNIAKAGFFAADRAVKEYADRIWGLKPLKLK